MCKHAQEDAHKCTHTAAHMHCVPQQDPFFFFCFFFLLSSVYRFVQQAFPSFLCLSISEQCGARGSSVLYSLWWAHQPCKSNTNGADAKHEKKTKRIQILNQSKRERHGKWTLCHHKSVFKWQESETKASSNIVIYSTALFFFFFFLINSLMIIIHPASPSICFILYFAAPYILCQVFSHLLLWLLCVLHRIKIHFHTWENTWDKNIL